MLRRKRRLPPSLFAARRHREFMLELDRRCPPIMIATGASDDCYLAPLTVLDPNPANYKFESDDDLDDD